MEFIEKYGIYLVILAIALAILIIAFLIRRANAPISRKIHARIKHRRYMSMQQFIDNWQIDKKDYPGCYVILIYDKKLIVNPMNYDDIYVGQSVNVRHRVFSHIMGHGNGNVYYGLKSGCKLYIVITKCRKNKLNDAEKELIRYFNATSSLNMTRGGSARR